MFALPPSCFAADSSHEPPSRARSAPDLFRAHLARIQTRKARQTAAQEMFVANSQARADTLHSWLRERAGALVKEGVAAAEGHRNSETAELARRFAWLEAKVKAEAAAEFVAVEALVARHKREKEADRQEMRRFAAAAHERRQVIRASVQRMMDDPTVPREEKRRRLAEGTAEVDQEKQEWREYMRLSDDQMAADDAAVAAAAAQLCTSAAVADTRPRPSPLGTTTEAAPSPLPSSSSVAAAVDTDPAAAATTAAVAPRPETCSLAGSRKRKGRTTPNLKEEDAQSYEAPAAAPQMGLGVQADSERPTKRPQLDAAAAGATASSAVSLPTDALLLISEPLSWKDFLAATRVCRSWRDRLTLRIKARGEAVSIKRGRVSFDQLVNSPLRRHVGALDIYMLTLSRGDSLMLHDRMAHLAKLRCSIDVSEAAGPDDHPRHWPPRLRELHVAMIKWFPPAGGPLMEALAWGQVHMEEFDAQVDRASRDLLRLPTLTSLAMDHPREAQRYPSEFDMERPNPFGQLWKRDQIDRIREHLPNLTELTLNGHRTISPQELLWLTEEQTGVPQLKIRKMKFGYTHLTAEMGQSLLRLPSLTDLTCHFDLEDPAFLAGLPNLTRLDARMATTLIRLRAEPMGDRLDRTLLVAALCKCTKLKELTLLHSDLTEQQMKTITDALPHLQKLRTSKEP
jgi:hypothetical protein